MRIPVLLIAFAVVCGVISSARAGISVSSYDNQAQANAYAPLDKSAYYTDHSQHNISPAVGDVNEDWNGTNAGGSDVTWHIPAMAHADSTTTITPLSLAITGAGSFQYQITTTSSFSEPLQHGSFFTPGVNTSVGGIFTIDQPAVYSISVILNGDSNIAFSSFSDGVLLLKGHSGSIPRLITMSGVLAPGQYEIAQGRVSTAPPGFRMESITSPSLVHSAISHLQFKCRSRFRWRL